MTKKNLEIGQRIGHLTVIGITDEVKRRSFVWEFLCDCGNKVKIPITDLSPAHGRKYCGKDCKFFRESLRDAATGRMDIKTIFIHEVATRYKSSARTKHIPYTLSEDDIERLIKQNCFYCGAVPTNKWKDAYGRASSKKFIRPKIDEKYNGIDRVDNSRGYEIDNVVTCCYTCNRAKNNTPVDEFLSWIDNLVEFRSNK